MKPLIAALVVLAAGGAVLMTGRPPVGEWSAGHTKRMRGKDAYYSATEREIKLPRMQIRLRGGPQAPFFIVGPIFTLRPGAEHPDPDSLIQERMPALIDALTIKLSDYTSEDLDDKAEIYALKRKLRDLIEVSLFPKGEARVERVFFDPFLKQSLDR